MLPNPLSNKTMISNYHRNMPSNHIQEYYKCSTKMNHHRTCSTHMKSPLISPLALPQE